MIRLQPEAWRWATWRDFTPLPVPEARPFNQAALIERIDKLKDHWNWWSAELARIPPRISHQEAFFWLKLIELVRTTPYQNNKPRLIATMLSQAEFNWELTSQEIKAMIEGGSMYNMPPEGIIPFISLFSLEELVDFLCHMTYNHYNHIFISGFHQYVVPYLAPEERDSIRQQIREPLTATPRASTNYYGISPIYYIAAAVGGFSSELDTVLSGLPDNSYNYSSGYYYTPSVIEVIYGLDDSAAVERHARRLKSYLFHPPQVIGWLAHTETQALDWVQQSIERARREDAEKLFRVLALVEDEAAVPVMIDLQKSLVGTLAAKWLSEHKDIAARGAAQMFISAAKEANSGRDFLRIMKRKGDLAELQAVYETLTSEQQPKFKAEILEYVDDTPPAFTDDTTPDWLKEALATVPSGKKVKAPAWVDITDLPPLIVDRNSLNNEQGKAALLSLSKSSLENPQPLVKALKEHIATPILDRFVWELFDLWQSRGAPSKERWAMNALGLLGGDATALKLTPFIRRWPGESQHQRAVNGLNCLRAIGSDTALMQINSIAQKSQHGGIKRAARQAIEDIAKARNMTRDQLDDRIVPDCGLDEDGRRVFDFGPRKFTFVLDADLKPQIRDETGKLKSDLPKPTQKDDMQLAEQSILEWKLIKKQVREVAKVQGSRLESALIGKRRWTQDEFETFIVNHPLMIHLARRLLWGSYNGDRNPVLTFRITDEKDYANAEDDTMTLEGANSIGLVHPLQLNEDELAAWNEIFSDYEIVPPFPQLARKVYKLLPEEADATEITRFADIQIESLTLVGILQRLGWQRGSAMDGGAVHGHLKPFPDEQVTAFIEYQPGMPIGAYGAIGDQKVTSCYFLSGVHTDVGYHEKKKSSLKLGSIDVVVMSEILRDLSVIAYRGEK